MSTKAIPKRQTKTRHRNRLSAVWLVAVLGACCTSAWSATIDRVVLVVNDQAVTDSEFRSLALIQNPDAHPETLRPQLGTDTTEKVVDELLLLGRAAEVNFNFTPSDAEIDTAVQKLAGQNQLPVTELLNTLESRGIDMRIFRRNVANRLRIEALVQQAVVPRVEISNLEVQARLTQQQPGAAANEYELLHLLVPIRQGLNAADIKTLRENTDQARSEWADGTEADALLSQHGWLSSSSEGGYLGWRSADQLPESFVAAVSTLNAGEISAVIESPNGFHLLKLVDKRSGQQTLATRQEHQVRHILLLVNSETDAEAVLEKALSLRTRILAGEDFATLAKATSDDPGSRAQGGELGWIDPAAMVPAFSTAVTNLPVGKLSEPVLSRFGYHLIEVQARRATKGASMEEQLVHQQLFTQKVQEELDSFLNDLRQVAHIEVLD